MDSRTTALPPLGDQRPTDRDEITAPDTANTEQALTAQVERGFTFAILLSALRCTIQYVILPFVLPWIGVAGGVPAWLTLALSTLALLSLVRNIRYLWRMRYSRRWGYVTLTVLVMAALILFVVLDLRALFR